MLSGLGRMFGSTPVPVAPAPSRSAASSSVAAKLVEPGLPLAQVPAAGLDDLIARAKRADVPRRIQTGPTCGLFAFGMVMDFWHQRDASAPTAIVREDDVGRKGFVESGVHYPGRYNFPPTTDEKLLTYAQKAGLTQDGELYDADNLAKVVSHFGYQVKVTDDATMADLYRLLDAGRPAIIALDFDTQAQRPADLGGMGAHYVVIEGYFDQGGERYIVAKHGDNRGDDGDCVWRASDVQLAWNALRVNDFYASSPLPSGLDLPAAGPRTHDIEAKLNDKLLEIVPPGEPFVLGGRTVAAPT